ncbi:adenylate/guanylate cyclase domain-containing protein [Brunnivagina elsteri]|uniref:Adenylate cyclase n=1 Tax=Brunnivagina elsteri CCALA 953 TaxID=987040 RepID=A0A2A2TAN4_9CYAN|nr:adenylate/guanylate cyclase domain-containing protein [Calothrix elsteri]PAX47910.1 adenylate cyclase [Calothrix elsteri CCALA 953]
MQKKTTLKTSTSRLTAFYIASLSLVAFLSVAGQVVVQGMLAQQEKNLEIVSLIRQRQTLCQQMTKAVMRIKLESDPNNRQQRINELKNLIVTWKDSGEKLSNVPQNISGFTQAQKAIWQQKLQEMNPAGTEFREIALQMMGNGVRETLIRPGRRNINPGEKSSIAQLFAEENTLMQGLDRVADWYNQETIAGVNQLKQMEYGLLAIMLLVLLLEGFLVFRPAVQKLQDTMSKLGVALHDTQVAQEQSENLLLNILPQAIAQRLKKNQPTGNNLPASNLIADGYSDVTVMFADIVGFTDLSGRIPPQKLVDLLNQIFSRFDLLAETYNLEKIKTIGDAYMVVGGLPQPRSDHAIAIAAMALDMIDAIAQFNLDTGESFQIRIGINSGAVVAGVIGIKKFIYDLWGDTVNIASRMESHGEPGRVHVSNATFELLEKSFLLEERGIISVKGKGDMQTYWLKSKRN